MVESGGEGSQNIFCVQNILFKRLWFFLLRTCWSTRNGRKGVRWVGARRVRVLTTLEMVAAASLLSLVSVSSQLSEGMAGGGVFLLNTGGVHPRRRTYMDSSQMSDTHQDIKISLQRARIACN